jgi:four helix bundle protein
MARTTVKNFRDLRVYQAARSASLEIFVLSKKFPPEEKYSLTDQIRRAARSVSANIAEGWKKRRYPASFVSKLTDADSEAGEVQSWLDSCLDCDYITRQEFEDLDETYRRIGAQLNSMIQRPHQWCDRQASRNKVRKAR